MSSAEITYLPTNRPQPPQRPGPRSSTALFVSLLLLLGLLGHGACKAFGLAPIGPAAPAVSASGSAAPAPADALLDRLERAVRLARLTLPFARLGCEMFVNLAHQECTTAVDTLAELADAGAQILKTAKACQEGGEAMCLESALRQADELLPKIERLLERAELLAQAPQGAAPAAAAAASVHAPTSASTGSMPATGGGGGAGGQGGGPR
jgi:hypothetical protein